MDYRAAVVGLLGIVSLTACLVSNLGGRRPVSDPSPGPQGAVEVEAAPAVLIGAGDISVCGLDGDDQTAALLEDLLARYPDALVFTAGDNVQTVGAAFEFQDCFNPTWGRFRSRIRPSPGNHDWYTEAGAAYFTYFGELAGPPGLGYYSYDFGDWHVVSLNSNCLSDGCGAESRQAQWLRADLERSAARCTLIYWHHPLWSSGWVPIDRAGTAFWQIAYEAGADVVVNGHDHHYERFGLLDANGRFDPENGMRLFIAGTGGAWLFEVGAPLAITEALDNRSHGLLVLFLYPDRYQWEFVAVEAGGYSDSGGGQCH